jgi:dipeptidyl aminopeptidase/acylaminoacyl peptidase
MNKALKPGLRLAVLSLSAFLLFNHSKTDGQELLTEQDVARLSYVVSSAISPDGKYVAYGRSVQRDLTDDESGPAFVELHVVDAKGNSRPFVTGEVNVSGITWTPNGKGISYLAKRGDDEHASIYVIPVDGGESQKMVEFDTAISAFTWSPDGEKIAFLAKEEADKERAAAKDKGFDAEIYEEQTKPTRIFVVDSDIETNDEPVKLETAGSASEISFSPDGSKIVAALAPTAKIDDFYMYRRIRVIDAESGTEVAAIDNPGKLGPIKWSPSGKYLAICSGEDINDPSAGRLTVVSANGGKPKDIMPEYLPNITHIHWLSDDAIAFLAEDSCGRSVGQVNRDGSNRRIYSKTYETPIFAGLSASDDNSVFAFHGSTADHPDEVFMYKDEKLNRLTEHNAFLNDRKLGKQEVVSWQSRDGKRIDGVLLYPVHYQPGTRYPLIIMVHGGPEASVSHGWNTRYSDPGQVAAGRGFFVFYPNYRGSTGRGVAFAKDHQADYGGKEFNDVIDGLDHLIAKGLVDKTKVGITGGSYGGFATAWCSTFHSERFAAGVMFVGISNQISKSGTTDIPDEMYHVHARKRIWEDWQFFLERSPIYYVEKCQTPLLILHGKNDTRVHPSQSMELYRNLKILDKPIRLVFYPGEGHGNRKSASRYDYNLRMMRWMQHYLIDGGGKIPPLDLDYRLDVDEETVERGDGDSD